MSQLDKPNVALPLAASYNERGSNAYATTITNGLDQRKINSLYEPVQNAMTGKSTLYLAKRPGVTAGTNRGTSGQITYTVWFRGDQSSLWVFSTSGDDIRASDTSGTTVIVNAAGYRPNYVDETPISGTNTVVVQITAGQSNPQRVFYASARSSWAEITDGDFAALFTRGKMEFMDGFAFTIDSLGRIYNSNLNSLSAWTATNYITKQIELDRPTGLAKFKNQIIAFGWNTYEIFHNAGYATGSPLEAIPQLAGRVGMPLGTSSGSYYCVVGDKMYFVGASTGDTKVAGLFAYDGGRVAKVSTPSIDKILSNTSTIYSVHEFACRGRSAVAMQLTATDAATQIWLMYFPDWNEWFEWNSTVFTPVNSKGSFFGVGSNQHKIYAFDTGGSDKWQDDGTNYTMTHQFKLPHDGSDRQFMRWAGVKGDTARSALSLSVEFSDDDYQSWQTARTIDMTAAKKKHLSVWLLLRRSCRALVAFWKSRSAARKFPGEDRLSG